MNTNSPIPNPADSPPDPEKSPLIFFVAYVPGEGEKKNYLGNGKGGIRLFKSEGGIRKHLRDLYKRGKLTQWAHENVVVHPIEGKIAVPDEVQEPHAVPIRLPLKNQPTFLNPLITMAKEDVPTSLELMNMLERNKPKRKRH